MVDNHIVVDSSYQNPGQWAALWAQVGRHSLNVTCASRSASAFDSDISPSRPGVVQLVDCRHACMAATVVRCVTCSPRAQLLKDMIADPAVKNRVMIDVMNEPGERCAHACLPAAASRSLSAGI